MKVKALGPFKCKLLNPCTKILRLFKFSLRKPLFISRLRFRRSVHKTDKRNRSSQILSVFRSLRRRGRDEDQVMELKSFSEVEHHKAPFPSPLTPAYVRLSTATKKEASVQDDVEDACRSFENYLVEMIVEEGKMRDLADVEELLYCWKNLKSPVFIDLVCRFYGELCRDLFSNSYEDGIKIPKSVTAVAKSQTSRGFEKFITYSISITFMTTTTPFPQNSSHS